MFVDRSTGRHGRNLGHARVSRGVRASSGSHIANDRNDRCPHIDPQHEADRPETFPTAGTCTHDGPSEQKGQGCTLKTKREQACKQLAAVENPQMVSR